MHVQKHSLNLLEQHSQTFEIWSASIRIKAEYVVKIFSFFKFCPVSLNLMSYYVKSLVKNNLNMFEQ